MAKSTSLILKQVLDLPAAIAGFYIQDAVLIAISNAKQSTMLFRLQDDINELRIMHHNYVNKLAGALFDYISIASFGEARHASNEATYYIHHISYKYDSNDSVQCINTRNQAYHYALKFNPHIFLPVLSALFEDYKWSDNYGGNKWENICKAGIMYNDMPDKVFIDHTVDLSHNGGSMFNKDVLFFKYSPETYTNMLNAKKDWPSILVDKFLNNYPIALSVKPFLRIASKLGIISEWLLYGNDYVSIEFPDVIKWGLLPITSDDVLMVEQSNDNEDDEDNNSDDKYDDNYDEDEANYDDKNGSKMTAMKITKKGIDADITSDSTNKILEKKRSFATPHILNKLLEPVSIISIPKQTSFLTDLNSIT